jgi:hypothetical protein
MTRSIAGLTIALGSLICAQTLAQSPSPPAPAAAPVTTASAQPRNDYSKPETWLCRPGRKDACTVDISTTIVSADGKLKREKFKPNARAEIDCFYVYPTVSLDTTPNSDMTAGFEENSVIKHQFARFASQCRTYAPLYRQVTLTALRAVLTGKPMAIDRALAYNDVVDAWNYYLEHDNHGRGVVLIGHSQGSGMLTQLIRNEIERKPVQSRIVSAILMGTNLGVPTGKDVGGAFQSMPLCRSATQLGCAIAYASFRENVPPPENSRFGKAQGEGLSAACVNPAALGGGRGELHSYLASGNSAIASSALPPKPWVTPEKKIDTPFVSVPGLLSAECVSNEAGYSYLAVRVNANPNDPRTDDIVGDVVVNGQVLKDWGLHLIDANLAMGNLVDIVHAQAKAYKAAQH